MECSLKGLQSGSASELGDGSLFIEDPRGGFYMWESEFAEMTKYIVHNIWRNCVLVFLIGEAILFLDNKHKWLETMAVSGAG